jgi:nitrilase
MTKLAVIQRPPVYIDKQRTLHRAVTSVEEAAGNGAAVIVFPETYIPGYPAWIWRLRPGSDWDLNEELHAALLDNAVSLNSDDLNLLIDAAKRHQVTIVCGLHERDHLFGLSTLYNTVIVIGPDGHLLNKHRKLMPTNPERMVWGLGDASGLKVIDTPVGRIGVLICWENYMPLARYALYAQGIEFYIAPTYDSGDGWISTMRHVALEGRCYVIGSGHAIKGSAFQLDFPGKSVLYPDEEEWINPGDSVVVAPDGNLITGPLRNEYGILYAECDRNRVAVARRTLDVVGHYSRPDVFSLQINTQPQYPVTHTIGN